MRSVTPEPGWRPPMKKWIAVGTVTLACCALPSAAFADYGGQPPAKHAKKHHAKKHHRA
jgi:hypothetical protein